MNNENVFENSILQFCVDAIKTIEIPADQGFIAVNYKNSQNKNITYIKPFYEGKLPEFINNNPSVKEKFLRAYKQNVHRDTNDIYYYKNLIKKANSLDHFTLKQNDFSYNKNGFIWNNAEKELIEYLKKNALLVTENIQSDGKKNFQFAWDCLELILDGKWKKNVENELFYHNDFDFFFLKSETGTYQFIPVPILSAITIWYVLDDDEAEEKFYFEPIYDETRYVVLNHVIEAISTHFTEIINKNVIRSKSDFIKEYVKSLAGLVLPIAYRYCNINKESNKNCLDENNVPRCMTDLCDDSCFQIQKCSSICQFSCTSCRFKDGRNCQYIDSCNPLQEVYSEYLPCPFIEEFISQSTQNVVFKEVFNLTTDFSKDDFYFVTFYLPTFKIPYTGSYIPGFLGDSTLIQNHLGYKNSVRLFKSLISSNYRILFDQWKVFLEVKKHATRAAISQAMLRNGSHNHGSHVLVNLISADKISIKQINKYINRAYNYNYYSELSEDEQKLEGQIAIFNKYIKGRMDFLSEITYGISNIVTSVKLAEVYRELDKNLLILNHITGIENFKYRINFIKPDEIPIDQLFIAFPSDIIGCQALYNIIENVIRNTAKYGTSNESDNSETVFTLEISDISMDNDKENHLYKVEVYDNRNHFSEQKLNEILDIIKMPVIDNKTNELRSNGIGMIEIQACAAFLRQIDVSEIDSEHYYPIEMDGLKNKFGKFPILEPFLKDSNCLGYRFYVQKPKEFLFVGVWNPITENQTLILEKNGINFITPDKFIESLENEVSFYHQFLLYDNTINDKEVQLLSPELARNSQEKQTVPLNEILKANRSIEGVPAMLTRLPVRMMDVTEYKNDLIKLLTPKEEFSFDVLEVKIWFLWKEQLFQNFGLNQNCVIKLIGGPDPNVREENEYTICLLNHDDYYQECKNIPGLYAIEPLSSNARKRLPGWKDSYGTKINEYIEAIQKRDYQKLIIKEYMKYLSGENINIDVKKISTYADINKILNAKRDAGELEASIVGSFKSIGASIKSKYDNENTYFLTRNVIKIFEASKNQVIVIDERIQDYANRNYLEIKNQEIFENIKCYLPSKELVKLADRELIDEQKSIILTFINEKIKSSGFLVIHYGLLERLYNNEENRSLAIRSQLSEWAKSIRVVVTSGRGKHSLDLPDDVCYVNLSPVTNVFIENRSKYAINYLLNQSRR